MYHFEKVQNQPPKGPSSDRGPPIEYPWSNTSSSHEGWLQFLKLKAKYYSITEFQECSDTFTQKMRTYWTKTFFIAKIKSNICPLDLIFATKKVRVR